MTKGVAPRPVHSIITNSTYDGLCYNAGRVQELLDPSVDRIHFDEAWYAYARFNPLYRDRHAMHGDPKDHKGPTIFATHSTHKLLAALSQASFLHIRDGRNAIPHSRFNESYMMHASTSPLYPIIVSNDITAAMMDGPGGPTLTNESIEEAVSFRQTIGRVHNAVRREEQWFFSAWNADTVRSAESGKKVAFEEASARQLATDPDCWVLHPGETWHGFGDLEDGYCMLDPIKVSIVTPGVADKGGLDKRGIPASLVTSYLHYRGRRGREDHRLHHPVPVLDRRHQGQVGHAAQRPARFQARLRQQRAARQVLPHLPTNHAAVYGGVGLRDLADQMFAQLRESRQTHWLAEAFSTLPEPVMTPNAAYQFLVRDEIEHVPLDQLANRVLATSVVPYPPGIPDAHARRVDRRERRAVSRLPARTVGLGQALPRLRPRHARRRESRRHLLRAVPEGGADGQQRREVSAPGRKMSLTQATMLVAGNMIGTGVFLLPVNLAQVGGIAIFGWVIATAGVAALGLAFAKLGELNPQQGGPYAYARDFLGPYAGFQTNYVYWFGNWIGNIAIAVAAIGYLAELIPGISSPPGERVRHRSASSGCSRSPTSSARASSARWRPGRWRSP